jgi:hypothetical protein
MGAETANVHLGDAGAAKRIGADLRRRSLKEFERAAAAMAETVMLDWREYRRRR